MVYDFLVFERDLVLLALVFFVVVVDRLAGFFRELVPLVEPGFFVVVASPVLVDINGIL